jgi:hypothetical protein
METILRYFFSLIGKLPMSRRPKLYYRLYRRKINSLARRHPTLVYVAICIMIVYVVFHPEFLPEWIRPNHTCHSIAIENGELYGDDGDQLRTSQEERPCKHRTAVAIEWYNWAEPRDPSLKGMKLVTASIFMDGAAINQSQDTWIERTLFREVNKFSYHIADRHHIQQIEPTSLCGGNGVTWDRREGFIISTNEARPGNDIEECYWAPSAEEPGFNYCNWQRLQLFIPSLHPKNWCPDAGLFDRWWSRGTRKISFSNDRPLYSEMRKAAHDRWSVQYAKDIPESQWRKFTEGMPKICIRSADMSDKIALSSWRDFGSITTVWCDY